MRKHDLQTLNIFDVLFFLQGYVECILGNCQPHAVQVLGFSNDRLQIFAEVDDDLLVLLSEDRVFHMEDHGILYPQFPIFKKAVFEFPNHSTDCDIILCHHRSIALVHHVLIRLKADNGLLYPVEKRLGPCNCASHGWLILEDGRVVAMLFEQMLYLLHFIFVPHQNV